MARKVPLLVMLDEEAKSWLAQTSEVTGAPQNEIVRRALDAYRSGESASSVPSSATTSPRVDHPARKSVEPSESSGPSTAGACDHPMSKVVKAPIGTWRCEVCGMIRGIDKVWR